VLLSFNIIIITYEVGSSDHQLYNHSRHSQSSVVAPSWSYSRFSKLKALSRHRRALRSSRPAVDQTAGLDVPLMNYSFIVWQWTRAAAEFDNTMQSKLLPVVGGRRIHRLILSDECRKAKRHVRHLERRARVSNSSDNSTDATAGWMTERRAWPTSIHARAILDTDNWIREVLSSKPVEFDRRVARSWRHSPEWRIDAEQFHWYFDEKAMHPSKSWCVV